MQEVLLTCFSKWLSLIGNKTGLTKRMSAQCTMRARRALPRKQCFHGRLLGNLMSKADCSNAPVIVSKPLAISRQNPVTLAGAVEAAEA